MPGLFTSLNIGVSGLQAAQAGLSVTSNNIGNINTPGYTKQRVQQSERYFPSPDGGITFGDGVSVDKVVSLRDNILEQSIARSTQQQSQSQAYSNAMSQIEAMFNDGSGSGLQSALSAFYGSFTQLAATPSNGDLRQAVLNAAQNLTSTFNTLATNLSNAQAQLDQQVDTDVQQINSLSSQIASLNKQVAQLSPDQRDSSPLLDQRTQLVQQLAAITGVVVSDNTRDGTISVTTGTGTPLVCSDNATPLTTAPDSSGHQRVYSQGKDITDTLSGGELAGVIQARDKGISDVSSQLDTFAFNLANSVNALQTTGYDVNGTLGNPLFNIPAAVTGSAANISVALTDGDGIAASTSNTSGGDNKNALAIADLQNQSTIAGKKPLEFYSNMISQLGNGVSQANADAQAQQLVLTQLQQQRSSICGVSLDEESVNLIQYQRAYEASARVISVISDLTSVAVNLGAQ